jgi:hypothetical protein
MINQTLETFATRSPDRPPLHLKRKAISVLLPYAVRQQRDGKCGMLDALLRAVGASARLMWTHVGQYIPTLFNEASPQAIVLVSPYVNWERLNDREDLIPRWATAALAAPEIEEVDRSVVETLLHIASIDSLQPHIPVSIWVWLKKRPSLPPVCLGRSYGTKGDVVRHVRALGDIEILKSYFLLVWSERGSINQDGSLTEMQISIREDFGGVVMGRHRQDLIERLDYILDR